MRFGWIRSWREAIDILGPVRLAEPVFQALGYFLLWAASTFGALLVFRISMRRARIRPVHVGRCVVYSFDAALWGAVLLAAVGVATLAASYILRARGFLGVAYIIVAIPYMLAAVELFTIAKEKAPGAAEAALGKAKAKLGQVLPLFKTEKTEEYAVAAE